jgi:hypothetical protein
MQKKFQTYGAALKFATSKRNSGYRASVTGAGKSWEVNYFKKTKK